MNWNLIQFKSEKWIGWKLGKFLELDTNEYRDDWKRSFLSQRLELEISKLLVAGFPIPRSGFSRIWVQFKYEKLAEFCYACGYHGHTLHSCRELSLLKEKATFLPNIRAASINLRRGPIIRVTQNLYPPFGRSQAGQKFKGKGPCGRFLGDIKPF